MQIGCPSQWKWALGWSYMVHWIISNASRFWMLDCQSTTAWGGASGRFDRGSGQLGKGLQGWSQWKKKLLYVAHAKLGCPIYQKIQEAILRVRESFTTNLIQPVISGVKVHKQQRNPPNLKASPRKDPHTQAPTRDSFLGDLDGRATKNRQIFSGGRCGWDVADAVVFFERLRWRGFYHWTNFHSIDFHWSISLV